MISMGKRLALVIGIAKYQNLRKLPYVEDAKDIAALLMDTGYCGYPAAHVRLLEETQATRSAILEGLAELAEKAGQKSTVFISFSGHGGQIKEEPHKGQYLLPIEAVYPADDDLARTAISR